ncbi:MAG TPA: Dam family site-specific DNA-(adenine-N6)-methyltransferase [Bryobacteraceae bacterium]|nr:Dam family site-specific DNA-(adenine-N6)-methyltransferase [Bryobacteraceae bacterium]
MKTREPVPPFLKWPGGKRWAGTLIADVLRPHLKHTYYEPFLGGGSVFFALRPESAVLSDINPDLINTFQLVRDHPLELIRRLKRMRVEKATYDRLRGSEPRAAVDRAVRFLYLNRTAFGGIYRLNLNGQYNVPFGGGQRTPEVLWSKGLLSGASRALVQADIRQADFEDIVERAGRGDAVYCDPTYTVAHENNGFVRYNQRNFSWHDQERLASAAWRAGERGATIVISNAYHPSIKRLYRGARFRVLERYSCVSTDVSKRRCVREFLVVLGARSV